LTWAEPAGIGELGLMPEQFWSLTFKEFLLKWAAFARAEDRQRSLVLEHAVMTGQYSEKQRGVMRRGVNALRRYPIKRWLLPEPPT
jgi:hypothetical protein